MPMVSKAQWRKLFATDPKVADEFAHATPGGYRSLPEHAKKGRKHRGRRRR